MLIGQNIIQPQNAMRGTTPAEIFELIKNPPAETVALVARLRLVRTIDSKQYGILKRTLPYIVCGVFNPPFRKTENFGYCEYFMVDIDHIGDKELSLQELKKKIYGDSRVVMAFVSPSEDGLKVLFRLSERCHDHAKYSLFYKLFVKAFSEQYGLQQVIDACTSDVARACFVSHDPDAYFNANADTVKMENFVDFDNPFQIGELKRELSQQEKNAVGVTQNDPPREKEPDADTLAFIKQKLGNRHAAPQKPQVFVPEQLNQILENLKEYVKEAGVFIDEISDISYGKKFKMHAGMSQAEINLFFGKRGFSVVKSSRQGTSDSLNELMAMYIQAFIGDYVLLRENLATTYRPQEIKTEIPEYELIKQQAQLLFTEKNHREALPLYQKLWDNYPDKLDEWDGWRFAYCAQQLKDYGKSLEICRTVYRKYRDFKMIRNVYAWAIYHSEIGGKQKIEDENTFFRAGEGILKLTEQDDQYSPYTLAVMKILDYLSEKPNYPADKMLEWTSKLNPALLDDTPFAYTDGTGQQREIASKREQYYMLRTRALLEKSDFSACILLCEDTLALFEKFHYDNDVWFRWRIALCYEGLGEWQKALDLQLELLKRKKEWFIQKEIAEQYYRLGDYEKSLQYALDSALNFGDADKKINTYIVLRDSLAKTGHVAEAARHSTLIEKIRTKQAIDEDVRLLKKVWNSLKFTGREQFSGEIVRILPNGKAGFVRSDKGRQYYFSLKDFRGHRKNATAGTRVTFYLEEGFDAKRHEKTMNATKVEIRS
ncbi:MAG: hypothetical protein LBS52_05370 [Dysgonamonadaceae bacterium]|nr:hypothetical protein [Dysgonamonadaceae bacterium]